MGNHGGLTPHDRRLNGRVGGHKSWSQTPDRATRLEAAHAASPSQIAWHALRMGFDPSQLTEGQKKQAESARKLYYAELSRRARKGRKRGTSK